MSRTVLLRHARAGDRDEWSGDDRLRPLDRKGRKQARLLVDRLADQELDRIVSSPSVRCVETVRPLAEQRGLDLEERAELAEGAAREDVLALLDELGPAVSILCTHGDVIWDVLGEHMKKGELRLLERQGDRLRTVG